jgi:hypothetical protein
LPTRISACAAAAICWGRSSGTKQSGLPAFRLADPVEHEGLLHMAHRDAAVLLGKDPKLTSERGRAVRVLLRLFERSAAMRTHWRRDNPGCGDPACESVHTGPVINLQW